MKLEEIQTLARRQPFRPFTINLINGDRLAIDAPEQLFFPAPRPELVIAFPASGQMHIFEDEGIASVEEPQRQGQE
jgi:hypothetical protein